MIVQNSLTGGSNFDFVITTNGSTPLKATLAWHEPAATSINTGTINPNVSYLTNNLNLEIIEPGNTMAYPWVLNPANPAATATRGINNGDNVEQVLINSPAAGTYTIMAGLTILDSRRENDLCQYSTFAHKHLLHENFF